MVTNMIDDHSDNELESITKTRDVHLDDKKNFREEADPEAFEKELKEWVERGEFYASLGPDRWDSLDAIQNREYSPFCILYDGYRLILDGMGKRHGRILERHYAEIQNVYSFLWRGIKKIKETFVPEIYQDMIDPNEKFTEDDMIVHDLVIRSNLENFLDDYKTQKEKGIELTK
jgi:hypothetical protein